MLTLTGPGVGLGRLPARQRPEGVPVLRPPALGVRQEDVTVPVAGQVDLANERDGPADLTAKTWAKSAT